MIVIKVNDDDFGKSLAHKYIKRIPKPTGKGYYYVYPKDLKTPIKTLLSVFGMKDEKVTDLYQKNAIQQDYGATKQTFASHVLEYLINKVKWDNYFTKKSAQEAHKKPVKQNTLKNSGVAVGDDGHVDLFEKPKKAKSEDKLNRSLMRRIWGIYNPAKSDNQKNKAYNVSDKENEREKGNNNRTGYSELPISSTAVRTRGSERDSNTDVPSTENGDNTGESIQRPNQSGKRSGGNVQQRSIAEIKRIRQEVKTLLESKTDDQMTEDDKELLRQYEGAGGIKEDDKTIHGTLYEYYTPQKVVDKIWEIVDKYAPQEEKSVLEPSAGTGRFAEYRNDNFTLNEYDPISSRISRILYPGAKVTQGAFQRMFMKGNTPIKEYSGTKFDVVVGNPPYGEYSGIEAGLGEGKGHKRYEEYFIDRSLDTLKDGGILAFVVPSSFLRGKNSKIKEKLATKGRLMEAWRLPNGTFGTTGIGTDIIIIRKESGNSDDFSNNAYFETQHTNIIGTETERTGQYGKEKFVSVPKGMGYDDALELIDSQRIPVTLYKQKTVVQEVEKTVKITQGKPSKLVYGNIYKTEHGLAVYFGNDEKDNPQFELTQSESTDKTKGDVITGEKGAEYYFKGRIANYERIGETGARSAALKGNDNAKKLFKKEPKKTTYVKSIGKNMSVAEFNKKYSKNVDSADLPVWKATRYDGIVDVAKLDNKAKKHLANSGKYVIDSEGNWRHIINYASGNIYQKLDELENERDAIGEKNYAFNKSLLDAVKPYPKEIGQFTVSPISDFSKEFQIYDDNENDDDDDSYSLKDAFLKWAKGGGSSRNDHHLDFDKSPISQYEIPNQIRWADIYDYISQKPVKAERGDDKGTAQMEAQQRRNIRKETAERIFNRFLKEGLPEGTKKDIEAEWNRRFNSYVSPDYSSIPLSVDGMNTHKGEKEFTLMDAQIRGVSFLCNKGNGVLVHDVGVGKTSEAIVANVNQIQTGRAKKPIICVPKAVYKKWIKEIKQLFPNMEVNELGNFSKKDIAGYINEDGDGLNIKEGTISVVTYEALNKITFKEETINGDLRMDMLDSQTIYDSGIEDKRTDRERQAEREKIMEMLGVSAKAGEGALYWENLGFDNITVDELHNFRKVFTQPRTYTKSNLSDEKQDQAADEYKNIGTGQPAARAVKLFAISQLIQQDNNDRNIFGLTATPFNNSPIEVYSLLSLVARKRLKELHIYNMYEFLAQFAELKSEWSVNARGEIEQKQVMKNFKNLTGLQNLLTEYFDKVTGEDAGVMRPRKFTHINELELNDMQKAIIKAETKRMEDASANEPGATLVAMNNMRMATLSPSLVDSSNYSTYATYEGFPSDPKDWPTHEDIVVNSPKLKFVCDSVIESWKQKKDASQVIYMPRGIDQYPFVRDYLVKNGMPQDSIAFMSAKITLEKKEAITSDFNNPDGTIKVIIGSETIKEGVSLNGNSITTYNTMLGWNPTETTQVEGRIHRQGNKQGHIHIIYPLMTDSIDALMYQKYDEKASRIDALWSYKGDKLNVEDINPNELKFELIKDPTKRAKFKIGLLKEDIQMKLRVAESKSEVLHKDILLRNKATDSIESLTPRYDAENTQLKELKKDFEGISKNYEKSKKEGTNNYVTEYFSTKQKIDSREYYVKQYKTSLKKAKDTEKLLANKFQKNGLISEDSIKAKLEEYARDISSYKIEIEAISKDFDKYVEQAKKEIALSQKNLEPLDIQIKNNVLSIMGNLRPMKDVKTEILREREKSVYVAKSTGDTTAILAEKVYGIWVQKKRIPVVTVNAYNEFFGKSIDKTKLVKKEINVTRGGKTFKQIRYVRPDEGTQAKGNKIPVVPVKNKGNVDKEGDSKRKIGEIVLFDSSGEKLKGKVIAVGKDGVTVLSGEKEYKVLHKDVMLGDKTQVKPSDFNAGEWKKQFDDADATVNSIINSFDNATEIRKAFEETERKNGEVEPTHERYRLEGEGTNAIYTPERTRLHVKIITLLLSPDKLEVAKPKQGEKPTFTMLGGRGGSGKSWFTNKDDDGEYNLVNKDTTVILDADEIKGMLPEYKGWNAAEVHEESSDILANALRICFDNGINICLDATMKTAKSAIEKFEQAKEFGYNLEAHYMHLPRQEAAKRAINRFKTRKGDFSGRYVPVGIVLGMQTNEDSFDKVKKLADRWSFRDNSGDGGPVLISENTKK